MIKEKLMEALKSAAADYNGGMGVNAAVAKAAEASDFNEQQTDRLVEMFNTALALGQEKSASDPTASCELASKSEVAKILLGSGQTQKTASAGCIDADYSFYQSSPSKTNPSIEARNSGMDAMVKAASLEHEEVPAELNVSQRSLYKIIEGKIDMLKSAAAAADDVARNMRIEAERCAVKIAKSIESPFADQSVADMFKAACQSENAVKAVSEYSTRVADSNGGRYAGMNVFDTSPVDDLLKVAEEIESCISSVSEYEAKRDMYLSKASEAECEVMSVLGIEVGKSRPASIADMLTGTYKVAGVANEMQRETDEAGMCVKIAKLLRESCVDSEEVAKLAEDLEKDAAAITGVVPIPSLSEAHGAMVAHEGVDNERRRVMNVRRAIILADLMSNDPIIRDSDPNMVTEAYKTMVMASPRVSLDKAQVRAFLRSAVNSVAISPSDAKVISDVDKGMAYSNGVIDTLTARDSSIKDSNK